MASKPASIVPSSLGLHGDSTPLVTDEARQVASGSVPPCLLRQAAAIGDADELAKLAKTSFDHEVADLIQTFQCIECELCPGEPPCVEVTA